MTPFFGGSIKQNVDENVNREMFENFTGTSDNYQKKKEVGAFFKPETNVSLDKLMNSDEYKSKVVPN